MPKNSKVAIYLRKSRSDEGLDALKNHKSVLTRLAESKGFDYDIYEEIGSSVISLDYREQLNLMLANLDQYSHILVMDLDRLARSLVVIEEIKEKLKYHQVKLMYATGQEVDFSRDTDEMVADFQSLIAKQEYNQIRKRMKIGKIEGARKGFWVNGVAPLGYSYDRNIRKLVINEDEYPLVKEIFSLASKNMSYQEIAINLNMRGYRTRQGNLFHSYSIKAILMNRAYVGYVTYRQKSKVKGQPDEVIATPNSHPAIITETEWLEIQKLIQNRRTNVGKTGKVTKSFVQGLVYCGCCGAKLTINSPRSRSDIYIKGCSRVDGFGHRCPNKSVKVQELEDFIRIYLMEYRNKLEVKAKQLLQMDTSEIKKELQAKRNMIEAEISKQEGMIAKLLDSYLEGIISKDIYQAKQVEKLAQIQLLKDDSRAVELQLEGLNVDRQIQKYKDMILTLDRFHTLDVTLANRVLITLIKRIDYKRLSDTSQVYRRAKLESEYKITMNKEWS
ncbi:recombinase family protein [Heyndrickxia ginsengihumi]|uniref:recombinase family protein n=1 Tax=Heyndrickxia ginsengihumi TaxID=363870 RepID=UPI003D1EDBDC